MKKILFISNISNRITNFAIPSIIAGQSLGYEFHMAANYYNFTDDPSKYNVKIHHIDIERNPFNIKNIKAYKQMLHLIKKEKFDVIHCNTPMGGVLGRICGTKVGVKTIIYTAHGFHFYKGAPLINRTLYKWAEMYLARKTDAIITINKEDYEAAKLMKLRDNGKVYYIPGVGIDVDKIRQIEVDRSKKRAEFGIKDNNFVITAVGRLEKNKNVENMIRAVAKTKNNINLLLCGDGEQADYLKRLAKELNVEDRVIFAGFRDDVFEILKASDAYMLISYREGLSRSLMEAMATGLPCIVSKIRGNVDLIEDGIGGYLVDPNDIDKIAFAINKIAKDKNLRIKMRQVNLKKIQSCSIENIQSQMARIYLEVIYKY